MKKTIFSLLLLCSYMGAIAQTTDEIINKHLIARGGTALDSVKTTKMDIELTMKSIPSMKSAVTYYTKMMQSHRIDMSVPGLYDVVICFSGNSGWSSLKMGDKLDINLTDSAEVQDLKYQTEILGPLYRYKEKGYTAEYVGTEKVNEVETYNIKVNAANNTTYNCYIDTATYSEIKRTVVAPSSGQMIKVELYYSNMQPVMGVMMPFTMEMHNRKGIITYNFITILLNATIDDTLFDVPSGK